MHGTNKDLFHAEILKVANGHAYGIKSPMRFDDDMMSAYCTDPWCYVCFLIKDQHIIYNILFGTLVVMWSVSCYHFSSPLEHGGELKLSPATQWHVSMPQRHLYILVFLCSIAASIVDERKIPIFKMQK